MENKNNKSNVPFAIIGIVFLVALVGGWWFYQSSKPSSNKAKPTNTNTTSTQTDNTSKLYQSASVGAQPANMLGSPTAEVTVEEFADYQCPTCASVHPRMKELTGFYGNRIKFIYRSYPLTQIHKNAFPAAVAAEAAGMQGKFWAMQDQLFNNQQEWSNSAEPQKLFEGYAEKIGLDIPKFQSDVVGMAAKQRVEADLARARSAGIDGTPTIFINGKKLAPNQMDFETMRGIIDPQMQTSGTQNQTSAPGQPVNSTSSSPTTSSNSIGNK